MENPTPNPGIRYDLNWAAKTHGVSPEGHVLHAVDPLSAQFLFPPVTIMIDPSSKLLTPNVSSDESSDSGEDTETVVSVSSSFYPGSHDTSHDTIFRTNDSVLFYLHTPMLQAKSTGAFHSLLTSSSTLDEIIDIPETSSVLNVIVHTLYDSSCAQHAPSFEVLEQAVDRMPVYDISPKVHILPGTPLYNLLLTHAPLVPLRVYALAANHKLHDLAIQSSSHTLTAPLFDITDNLATKMGAIYLKKLMSLHTRRRELFKAIILQPPELHPVTKVCNFKEQKRLSRAWALAAAYLAWDGKNDVPINTLQSTFSSLEEGLDCEGCKGTLRARIREIIIQWAAAPRTV